MMCHVCSQGLPSPEAMGTWTQPAAEDWAGSGPSISAFHLSEALAGSWVCGKAQPWVTYTNGSSCQLQKSWSTSDHWLLGSNVGMLHTITVAHQHGTTSVEDCKALSHHRQGVPSLVLLLFLFNCTSMELAIMLVLSSFYMFLYYFSPQK